MSEGIGWPAPGGTTPETVGDGFGVGDAATAPVPTEITPEIIVPIKTMDALRAAVARSMGLYYSGIATGGGAGYFRDTDGLVRFTVDDLLAGAVAYFPRRAANDTLPVGEWRQITGYDAQRQSITVEHRFGAAVQADMQYEIFRALSLDQWTQAVNGAITKAWPDVWERIEIGIQVGRALVYQLPGDVKSVLEVHSESSGYWAEYGRSLIPPNLWRLNHGDPLTLALFRVLPGAGWRLHVAYQRQYPELEDGIDETALDTGFILDQGRALAYQALAGETQGQAQASTWTQLMMYWQERADARRQKLGMNLMGIAPVTAGKGGKT